ncbi:MAG TPA: MqnA/MqnD/SBP family protein, partial [Nitrososphaeraceae archaeon]|nr:MqnA/MqnD/SBP family protein [Nitrososphaeraceae archaeon]
SPEFRIKHIIEDIETLNKRALKQELDVTAISAHAYAYLEDYVILRSGGSFGLSYGPIVISKKNLSYSQLRDSIIAIPGRMTSANLLLNLALGKFQAKVIPFHLITEAVLSDEVEAGLVIHESQITYQQYPELCKVLDLGEWWAKKTNELPLPLGINVANSKSMTLEQIAKFDDLFRSSILYGLDNIDEAVDYSMKYGRGAQKEVITKFIKMYVNDLTVDMGEIGKKSIEKIFLMASTNGILNAKTVNFI